MRNLHICPDEKFIDGAISLFEDCCPNENDYYIISNDPKLKYIKSNDVTVLSLKKIVLLAIVGRLNKYDRIFIHSLPNQHKLILRFIPDKVKVIWIGFGYDYYCYSNENVNSVEKRSTGLKSALKEIIFNWLVKEDAIFKKVDYFAPVLLCEYAIVKNKFADFNAKIIDWNYDNTSHMWDDMLDKECSSNNILVGNSATTTNNHCEVFDKLSNLVDSSRRVIVPLSYGNDNYKHELIGYCNQIDLNFDLMLDFLSLEEYFSKLESCAFTIMNHERQQAFGNIVVMLMLGSKVFLKVENPLYNHLVELGFIIYKFSEIDDEINKPLSKEEIRVNKRLIIDNYSRKAMVNKTKQLLKSTSQ